MKIDLETIEQNQGYIAFLPYGIATIENEGGLVSGARAKKIRDSGGATKYGISLSFLRRLEISEADFNHDGLIDEQDIVILNEKQSLALYFKYFWNNYYPMIAYKRLTFRIYDFGVNAGPGRSVRIWQNTINQHLGYLALRVDGLFGTKSLAAANIVPPSAVKSLGELSYPLYVRNLEAYYRSLKKPGFIVGWLRRLKTFVTNSLTKQETK